MKCSDVSFRAEHELKMTQLYLYIYTRVPECMDTIIIWFLWVRRLVYCNVCRDASTRQLIRIFMSIE